MATENRERGPWGAERSAVTTWELVTRQVQAAATRCNRDLQYIWANQEYANWIHRPLDDIIGQPISRLLGPEAFSRLRPYFERVLGGQPVRYEQTLDLPGIGPRWTSAAYTPTFATDGTVDGWVAVVVDVKDRTRTMEALQRSHAHLMVEVPALATLDNLAARLWQIRTLHVGVREILSAAIQLMGADKGNVHLFNRERGVFRIVAHAGFAPPFLDFFRKISIDASCAYHTAFRVREPVVVEDVNSDENFAPLRALAKASGFRALVWMPLVSSRGALIGMLSTHFSSPRRPSTESLARLDLYAGQAAGFIQRCQAERAVVESQQRFRHVANTAPVMIWMSGPDKRYIFFARRWLEFSGRPLESELGHGWAEGVHPEDLEGCLTAYTNAFERHESFQREYRLRRHDGVYRSIVDTGVPRRNPGGSLAGYIGTAIDVTERRAAEQALAANAAELRQTLNERRACEQSSKVLHGNLQQLLFAVKLHRDRLLGHGERADQIGPGKWPEPGTIQR